VALIVGSQLKGIAASSTPLVKIVPPLALPRLSGRDAESAGTASEKDAVVALVNAVFDTADTVFHHVSHNPVQKLSRVRFDPSSASA